MKTHIAALVGLLLLGMTGAASAATLFTPSMLVAGTDDFDCELVNVSSGDLTVQIQALNLVGSVLSESGEITLGPGNMSNVVVSNPATFAYCKFTVQGSKRKVRAAAHRVAALGSSSLNSLPAQ